MCSVRIRCVNQCLLLEVSSDEQIALLGGLLSKYWPSQTLLSFRVYMRSGESMAVHVKWSKKKNPSGKVIYSHVLYKCSYSAWFLKQCFCFISIPGTPDSWALSHLWAELCALWKQCLCLSSIFTVVNCFKMQNDVNDLLAVEQDVTERYETHKNFKLLKRKKKLLIQVNDT